jgi:hypothetical protein
MKNKIRIASSNNTPVIQLQNHVCLLLQREIDINRFMSQCLMILTYSLMAQ